LICVGKSAEKQDDDRDKGGSCFMMRHRL
jgi:hypothetical protein